jgi:lipid-binding SYLF domain-containing protein
MKDDVLSDLYKSKPSVQSQVKSAAGYGVFSNANVYVIVASFGGGYGVVHNSGTGKDTYMKMGEAGVGLGAGVKDYRLLFIFHTAEALDYFVTHGWSFGGQADAAAKAGQMGGAVGGEVVVNNVTIYQITEAGLALQATIKGTKFWRDDSLN